jgi:ABC-type uncharacterized transport system substrate-binding protein
MSNRRDFIAGIGSAAAAWPLAMQAQQRAAPVIGFLSGLRETDYPAATAAFHRGLGEQGYIDGQNFQVLFRWAELHYDRLPALALELVRRRVAVLFTSGGPASSLAAKSATATIPIVFEHGGDPVELGLVSSLNRPGGNITGVTFLGKELTARRLELLHEIAPAAQRIGFLVNPSTPSAKDQTREAEIAARVLGVHLVVENATATNEIESAFAAMISKGVGGVAYGDDPLFVVEAPRITALASRHALPVIYLSREEVEAGGLMSYGANIPDGYRIGGNYVGRILKGEKPADLPVQQVTRIETVLNLKAARALGIEVPTATLLRADKVIE